ncbi:MAG: glycosyltransferase [Lachnospiraceae bacterium]|nr:glycosyltransferase [Lachnospiraceae bacterium]
MRLSIIVPVYNMAADDKLKHCLDSLLAQDLDDYEVIAVDDASTDDSPVILREYEEKYAEGRKKVFRAIYCSENHRQGGARNRGMKEASGEWIGFMDSDDYAAPDMFKKLLEKAEATGADVVGCDYTIVDHHTFTPQKNVANNNPGQTGVLSEEQHKSLILRTGSVVTKIYKRSLLEENGLDFPEGIFYEDNCAAPLWSMYFHHFEYVPEPLYFYLTVSGSTTHYVTWEKCEDRIKAGLIFLEECKKRGLMDKYRDEIEFRFSELSYVTTLFSYMYSGKKRKVRNIISLSRMIKENVPGFRENRYYKEFVKEEDRKLIDLHMKNAHLFFVWYVMLFGYRKIVNRIRGN